MRGFGLSIIVFGERERDVVHVCGMVIEFKERFFQRCEINQSKRGGLIFSWFGELFFLSPESPSQDR